MSVIIFGNGPLPFEQDFPVTGPGARTWQIVRTVAAGLIEAGSIDQIVIVCLNETSPSATRNSGATSFQLQVKEATIQCSYVPLPFSDFSSCDSHDTAVLQEPLNVQAVVGTGSVLPYSVASRFARRHSVPVWIDVFGDPLCETQSQQEVAGKGDSSDSNQHLHVWKLLTDSLLAGDRFSALSHRHRYALLGQLGCSGRLNQFTADEAIASTIPYSVFPDDLNPLRSDRNQTGDFTIMWSGSFNTWMDVPTLTKGLCDALQSNPQLKLIVVGGSIPGYNDISYGQFLNGIKAAGVEGAVSLLNWQPYSAMSALYNRSNLGISIDRSGYEAELGSRTRLVNFLAAGVPVASTVVTELTQDLLQAGFVLPFEVGDAESLTETLLTAAQMRDGLDRKGPLCRDHILNTYNGYETGRPLSSWIAHPRFSGDHTTESLKSDTNNLTLHTQQLRESLD